LRLQPDSGIRASALTAHHPNYRARLPLRSKRNWRTTSPTVSSRRSSRRRRPLRGRHRRCELTSALELVKVSIFASRCTKLGSGAPQRRYKLEVSLESASEQVKGFSLPGAPNSVPELLRSRRSSVLRSNKRLGASESQIFRSQAHQTRFRSSSGAI
jgi:hypothetical protein